MDGTPRDVARAAEAIRAAEPALDVGAGSHAVLVVAAAPIDLLGRAALQATITRVLAATRASRAPEPTRHVVRVVYDGPDLAEVARAASMSRDEVVRAHVEREVEVEVLGFLPGFAYLAAIDPRLELPRRASPRTRVAPGSVGVAGRFTGIYPSSSPGGWHLLGRAVDVVPSYVSRTPPSLFAVGDRVRFEAVADDADRAPGDAGPASSPRSSAEVSSALANIPRGLLVDRVAALATVQDGGRARWLSAGVPPAGAVDPVGLAAANLAVGNDAAAAGLEVAGGGCRLIARGDVLASIDGERALLLRDGQSLDVSPLDAGPGARLCRYVAARGGLVVPEVLGARGTAVSASLGGLEGRPLRRGDVLPVGDDPGTRVPDRALLQIPGAATPLVLRLDPLPVAPPLGRDTLEALLAGHFTVARAVDRTGVRLDGQPLPRAVEHDARPEPVLPGAVQITNDGLPIVLGPDAAVTGGYPVIGVLRKTSLWSLYRLRPGAAVRFARA